MSEVIRNVAEIADADRQALEHVLGAPLHADQTVLLRVVSPEGIEPAPNGGQTADSDVLPEWCNVFEGLSDDEIAEVEQIMLTRANLTRSAN